MVEETVLPRSLEIGELDSEREALVPGVLAASLPCVGMIGSVLTLELRLRCSLSSNDPFPDGRDRRQ